MACTTHCESIQADRNWMTVRKHCWCFCVWGLGLCNLRMDQLWLPSSTLSRKGCYPYLTELSSCSILCTSKQGRARRDGKNYLENSLAQDPSQRTWWENEIWTIGDYIDSRTYNHLNSFMTAVMQEVYNTLVKTILFPLLLLFPPTHVLTFWKSEEDLQNLIL